MDRRDSRRDIAERQFDTGKREDSHLRERRGFIPFKEEISLKRGFSRKEESEDSRLKNFGTRDFFTEEPKIEINRHGITMGIEGANDGEGGVCTMNIEKSKDFEKSKEDVDNPAESDFSEIGQVAEKDKSISPMKLEDSQMPEPQMLNSDDDSNANAYDDNNFNKNGNEARNPAETDFSEIAQDPKSDKSVNPLELGESHVPEPKIFRNDGDYNLFANTDNDDNFKNNDGEIQTGKNMSQDLIDSPSTKRQKDHLRWMTSNVKDKRGQNFLQIAKTVTDGKSSGSSSSCHVFKKADISQTSSSSSVNQVLISDSNDNGGVSNSVSMNNADNNLKRPRISSSATDDPDGSATEETSFTCKCGFTPTTRYFLQMHESACEQVPQYPARCDSCGVEYLSLARLRGHLGQCKAREPGKKATFTILRDRPPQLVPNVKKQEEREKLLENNTAGKMDSTAESKVPEASKISANIQQSKNQIVQKPPVPTPEEKAQAKKKREKEVEEAMEKIMQKHQEKMEKFKQQGHPGADLNGLGYPRQPVYLTADTRARDLPIVVKSKGRYTPETCATADFLRKNFPFSRITFFVPVDEVGSYEHFLKIKTGEDLAKNEIEADDENTAENENNGFGNDENFTAKSYAKNEENTATKGDDAVPMDVDGETAAGGGSRSNFFVVGTENGISNVDNRIISIFLQEELYIYFPDCPGLWLFYPVFSRIPSEEGIKCNTQI